MGQMQGQKYIYSLSYGSSTCPQFREYNLIRLPNP